MKTLKVVLVAATALILLLTPRAAAAQSTPCNLIYQTGINSDEPPGASDGNCPKSSPIIGSFVASALAVGLVLLLAVASFAKGAPPGGAVEGVTTTDQALAANKRAELVAQEARGGHSNARHGPQLSLSELRQRVLGIHPTMPQSRTAMKFQNAHVHSDAVEKAYLANQANIAAHFAGGGGYRTWTFDYGSRTGVGFTNTGTLSKPVVQAVESTKVTIAFRPDPTAPSGFSLVSAYPAYP